MASISNTKTPPTRAQIEAELQALRFKREFDIYRRQLTTVRQAHGGGLCRADGWDISTQLLDGDFELDEPLTRQIFSAGSRTFEPASSNNSLGEEGSSATLPQWLNEYLQGASNPPPTFTNERFLAELEGAAIGAGNVLGNLNGLKEARNAAVRDGTTKKINAAVNRITSGVTKSVKINEYMTVYNANRSGKGPARPRIRITKLPITVIAPSIGTAMRGAVPGISGSMWSWERSRKAAEIGKLAANVHWSSRLAMLNGKLGTGVLTVGPSAVLDLYNSIERDASGDSQVNWRKFGIASAKSQSGNMMGVLGGALAGSAAVALGVGVAASAPVLVIGVVGGILVQAIWGWSGAGDGVENWAKEALE